MEMKSSPSDSLPGVAADVPAAHRVWRSQTSSQDSAGPQAAQVLLGDRSGREAQQLTGQQP